MMDFVEFLKENWQWLALVVIAVLNVVLLILKKAKVIKGDTAFEVVLKALPGFIVQAENVVGPGNGKEKWKQVVILAADCYRKASGEDLPDDFIQNVNLAIEAILTTPQKKVGD